MTLPSPRPASESNFLNILIDEESVLNFTIDCKGYAFLADQFVPIELYSTPEEQRVLYTTNWVIKHQTPYEYVDELFLTPGRSNFVVKRFSFQPANKSQVYLSVTTVPEEQGFTGRINDQFTQFIDAINDVILITKAEPLRDAGPRVLFVNDAFYRMTGYLSDEIIGNTPRILQGAETKESAKQRMRKAFDAWEQATCQIDNYTKNGEHFIVELHITPLKDAIGWWTHWVSLQRDVTQRINDEQKLLKQEALLMRKSRLANIGEISSNVFHEVYNPLTILVGHLHLLADQAENGTISTDALRQRVNKMLDASERMENILTGIRKLSRSNAKEQTEVFSANREMHRAVSLIDQLYKNEGIKLDIDICHDSLEVDGSPGKFQQIILNLLSNARDATRSCDKKWIKISLARESDECLLTVQNKGEQIQQAQIEQIFQPFYTTKDSDTGTGLGLSVVRQFVTDMYGSVTCRADYPDGAEFRVSLPLARTG